MAFVGAFSAAFSRLKGAGAASSLQLLVAIYKIQKLYLVWISRDQGEENPIPSKTALPEKITKHEPKQC